MNVYNYHPVTKEFLSQDIADPDPITPNRWLIPANSTAIEPPELGENQITLFNEEKKIWEITTIETYKPTYAELRAEEYPSIFDYIDGVVKGDQTQIDKYIKDCLAVKEKYPKTKNEV
jgi:hypothetical protein